MHNKTAIDYYPFNNTFSEQVTDNKSTQKKKKKLKTMSEWKIRRRGYNIGYRDSFDNKLPLLTREYNDNGDEQQLVIYRDAPYDINSLIAVLPIIKQYNPDMILFEYGRLPFFDKYIDSKFTFSNIVLPFKKLIGMVMPFRILQIGAGHFWYNRSKRIYKSEISSYGFESALDLIHKMANKRNKHIIPIVAGDLHHKITDTLRVFNDYLDLFNIATLLHYQIIDAKFLKTSARTQLGANLSNIMQMRLYPHMTVMNVYRNDILSCVINEIDGNKYPKILLISQAMRLMDLFDKLCGKSTINKWIKTIDNQHILMNKLNLYDYKVGMTNNKNTYLHNIIQTEVKEDILKCINCLGFEQTAFLLLPYPLNDTLNQDKNKLLPMSSDDLNEQEFVDQLKDRINELAQELKALYSSP